MVTWPHGQKDEQKATGCPDLVHSPSEGHPADCAAAGIPAHSVAFAWKAPVVHLVVDIVAAAGMICTIGDALHGVVLRTAGRASFVADAKRPKRADHPPGLAHAYGHSTTAPQAASLHRLDACLAAGSAGAETDCWQAAFGGGSNLDSLAAMAHDFPCSQMSAEQDHLLQTKLSVLQTACVLMTASNLRGS